MKHCKKSAGILLFRRKPELEVLLVHPGGPFWVKKDDGAWSIPKGEFDSENALDAAIRECKEELGVVLSGNFVPLTPVRQRGGKWVYAWALEADIDSSQLQSNTFELEWPPKSGNIQIFPEVDRAEWFSIPLAQKKILPSQATLIVELLQSFS